MPKSPNTEADMIGMLKQWPYGSGRRGAGSVGISKHAIYA